MAFAVDGLIFDGDDIVLPFMTACGIDTPDGTPLVSVGIAERGEIVAGAYFTAHHPGRDITVSAACRGAGLSTGKRIPRFYAWAFGYFDVPRITAEIDEINMASRCLCEGLGFRLEGIKRRAGHQGRNVIVYGLLKEDLKYGRR